MRANKGAAGIDDVRIDEFPAYLSEHWAIVKRSLLDGSYRPSPVKRVEIPKRTGGKRKQGIPTVLDRLIQQAILQVLQPLFDPGFSESSFGFRPNRSAHAAVRHVHATINAGYKHIVDVDHSKFFDRVNHDILMARVARKVKDKRVLRLIGRYLRAGVVIDGKVEPTCEGVPQGGPLSPLLANIVLDDFDKKLEQRGHRFTRYADDFMILVKSERAANRVMRSITRYLEERLKLVINQEKSKVVTAKTCEYLGIIFKGKQIVWSEQSLVDFKHAVRRLTHRSWGVSMHRRLTELSRYIRGWMNYDALSKYYRPIPLLDEWLRHRVRMCYVKRWPRPRTRITNLLRLSVPLEVAIPTGISSKSWWKLSRTPATQMGMNNAWLKEQGLVSIKELWVNFHYPNQPKRKVTR